ncbi:MAG: hypothetical protein RMY64_10745 [Nostoc sp. DedQUE08]|uniref:hypothetical protein n=1 Tax=Nostoc sp. DedQUE08 TaxID=3075393 RepID=UPI002AD5B099|nr:hypothetical protein [Nostoc sp. DedQUE08]MDZ8066098.1 hypothetical protein [Nostoc sp. DedQUE08]
MSQKVLSVKVDPEDWEWFKEVSRAYRTQAEAFKALKQVYQTTVEKSVKVFTGNEVYQSVCVFRLGDKLPPQWELKSAIEETIKNRKWYVFPDDRVVAIIQKSANGSKKWLEVAAEYPDEIWHEAKTDNKFKYQPVTTLNGALGEYQDRLAKMQQPAIALALANGWQTTKWHWDLSDLVREAEDYLQVVNQSEPIQTQEVYQSVCDTSESLLGSQITQEPLRLSKDALVERLAPKHVSLSTANTDEGRANIRRELPTTLHGIKAAKIPKWTAERDPEGLTWEPTDDTREHWVISMTVTNKSQG